MSTIEYNVTNKRDSSIHLNLFQSSTRTHRFLKNCKISQDLPIGPQSCKVQIEHNLALISTASQFKNITKNIKI